MTTVSDCPPSNPISIRTRSAIRHHLREDAVEGLRVDERNLLPEQAAMWNLVDELRTRGPEVVHRGADVVHLERDMVHPRAALREEPADRRVAVERRDELDEVRADANGGRLDALRRHLRAALDGRAEQPLVRLHRLVEVDDGHAEVVNAARVHAADAT